MSWSGKFSSCNKVRAGNCPVESNQVLSKSWERLQISSAFHPPATVHRLFVLQAGVPLKSPNWKLHEALSLGALSETFLSSLSCTAVFFFSVCNPELIEVNGNFPCNLNENRLHHSVMCPILFSTRILVRCCLGFSWFNFYWIHTSPIEWKLEGSQWNGSSSPCP